MCLTEKDFFFLLSFHVFAVASCHQDYVNSQVGLDSKSAALTLTRRVGFI